MMVTVNDEGLLRARPMHIARVDATGELWFLTSEDTEKVTSVEEDMRVAITLQGAGKQVSLSGLATVVRDQPKLEELWSLALIPWFPDGTADKHLVAIRFLPIEAEYWDSTGIKGVRYLFEAVKAVITRSRVDDDNNNVLAIVSM